MLTLSDLDPVTLELSKTYLLFVLVVEPTKETCSGKLCNLAVDFCPDLSWQPDWWQRQCRARFTDYCLSPLAFTVGTYAVPVVGTAQILTNINLNIDKHDNIHKNWPFSKRHVVFKNKAHAASLKSRKHGLGLPIHIKMLVILINIGYYTILVLNMALYKTLHWQIIKYCPCYCHFLGWITKTDHCLSPIAYAVPYSRLWLNIIK